MSLPLRCSFSSASVPHAFRCPPHRPRNSTSHERSLIRHLPVLSLIPPLIHHLFSVFFIKFIKRRAAAKTSRTKRKGAAAGNRQAGRSTAQPARHQHLLLLLLLALAPCCVLCHRHLRFLSRKKGSKRGNTPQILLTYRSDPATKRNQYLAPFLFLRLPPPHSARAGGRCREAHLYLSLLDPPASRGPVERRSGRSGVGCFLVLPVSWPS